MQFKAAALTDIGRKRSQNQDSLAALPELSLFLVADGMGGHRGGEIASAMAVEKVTEIVRKAHAHNDFQARPVIAEAIQGANRAIYERSQKEPGLQGMGTTTTALLFKGGKLFIGHVGDSRCYYLRPNSFWQLTRDHSLVQEKLRAGLITREELRTDQMKNVITRSVGFEPDAGIDVYEMDVQLGDVFLICSDGLSGMIEDKNIAGLVQKHLFEGDNIKQTVEALVQAANDAGGEDNVSVILVQVTQTNG